MVVPGTAPLSNLPQRRHAVFLRRDWRQRADYYARTQLDNAGIHRVDVELIDGCRMFLWDVTIVLRKNSHRAENLLPLCSVLVDCIKPHSAPTNIHDANRPILGERARGRPRQDDVESLPFCSIVPCSADQEHLGQATCAVYPPL